MKQNVLGIILARGGSKGIPNKNIISLNNKPLLAYSIQASLDSKFITHTYVSSDSEKILATAKSYGADIIKRPKKLATDTSSSESGIRHALLTLKKKGLLFDYLVLLQPTSPLRTAKDIDNAFNQLFKTKAISLISVYEPNHPPFKALKLDSNGYLTGIVNNKFLSMPRQKLPKAYLTNGAIYISDVTNFLKTGKLISKRTIPFVMPEFKSLEIDILDDLKQVKKILKATETTKDKKRHKNFIFK